MENKELKEKTRKNIKEEIAISNIRKEFDMKTNRNKKIIYIISSICAVFILVVGILSRINKLDNSLVKNNLLEIGELGEESLNIELNINKLKDIVMTSIDADIKVIEDGKIPDEFNFIENITIPENFKLKSKYKVYVKKNEYMKEYDILHDYVFEYKNNNSNIKISFSTIEKPIRDYYIEEGKNISKIGNAEVIISQWEEMYIVSFEYKNIYFDIETNSITENQLVTLLESIIYNTINNQTKEQDSGVKEKTLDVTSYPTYYSGKYIDNDGNNVILLTDDSDKNKKQICNILGIKENRTIFKKAKYTYEYLIDLQNRISQKMKNKELPFVTSSVLMENNNNIKVIVTSNNINDLNKIKELDTIGEAIEIKYEHNNIGIEDLLVNPE